jgi:ribose transport system ATP-binding protein
MCLRRYGRPPKQPAVVKGTYHDAAEFSSSFQRRSYAVTTEQVPLLETRGLTKRFFGTLALNHLDFAVAPGEIHALVGENGAGKSTLIKLLAGIYEPDAGSVLLNGQLVTPATQRLPIAFVHQDLGLVEELSVGENVALVAGFPRRGGLIGWTKVWQHAREIYHLMDVEAVDPRTLVQSLNAAEKAVLGIVRALALKAKVIVLDEPTAALPEPDVLQLLRILKTLRAAGTSIVYVSHRLGELFGLADRITVLRDGRLVRTVATEAVTPDLLVQDMLGHAVVGLRATSHFRSDTAPILTLDGLWIGGRGPVDCQISAGEIVGLIGLHGAGQEDIGRAISGASRLQGGTIRLLGAALPTDDTIGERIARGIALLPGDRAIENTFSGMTVLENLFPNAAIFGTHSLHLTSRRRERDNARATLRKFDVRPRSEAALIDWLSGGNQQKVMIARWLVANARILILEQPTAGVDIGVKMAIHGMLRDAATAGVGVIVVSSDFEEVATLCHRALVVSQGRIVGELEGVHLTVDELVAGASLGAVSAKKDVAVPSAKSTDAVGGIHG